MRHLVADLLRCVAWRLDPHDVRQAQVRRLDAIDRYARAERELLDGIGGRR